MMRSPRRQRRDDAPRLLTSRAEVQAQVDEHKAIYGCPGDADVYTQACPCGAKVLVVCASCEKAVLMLVNSKRRCRHQVVYHMTDGSTVYPFEGF